MCVNRDRTAGGQGALALLDRAACIIGLIALFRHMTSPLFSDRREPFGAPLPDLL